MVNAETTEGQRPTLVIASGEISDTDRAEILQKMGKYGLSAVYISPEHFSELVEQNQLFTELGSVNIEADGLKNPPELSAITSRTDYVTKEHFSEFVDQYVPSADSKMVSGVFNGCIGESIMGQNSDSRKTNHGYGPYPNLRIKSRSELGYRLYVPSHQTSHRSLDMAQYCIEVGSLIEMQRDKFMRKDKSPTKSDLFLNSLTILLQTQVSD